MKKAKSLWLVLALAIMLEVFFVVPVTATNGMMKSSFSGQLDETEHVEFERYPDTIPTEIIPQEQIDRLGHTRRLPQAEGDMQTVMLGNDDGTNSIYVFSYPVKYTDNEGRIRDKSNYLSLRSCIMTSRSHNNYLSPDWYCPDCIEIINNHLAEHHAKDEGDA